MSVLRKEKRSNYTVIDNSIFKDRSLSMKATGLLCIMLSLPDNWHYSIAGLTALVNDGETAVRSALKELQEAGYFRRETVKKGGKIIKFEYVISEYKNCEKPLVENPQQENPHVEKQAQLNTNISKTKSLRTKDIYTEFENLWEMYPKKQGKDKACKSYEKARKSDTTYEEVRKGILAYREFIEAMETDMQYVKMGSTFFSQKAWQDDYHYRKKTDPYTDMLITGDY